MNLIVLPVLAVVIAGASYFVGAVELFLLGISVLITTGVWLALRQYLRRRYPESPQVRAGGLYALAVFVVAMLALVFLDTHYRHNPQPDSTLFRVYFAVFGQKRYILTWPLFVFLILGIQRAVTISLKGVGSNGSARFPSPSRNGKYYRARYYHPTLSRFIAEDPIGIRRGDTNLYALCRQFDPAARIDQAQRRSSFSRSPLGLAPRAMPR